MRFPLAGPRVALRPFELADVDAAHRVYSDPRVMRWVGDGAVRAREQSEAMVRQYIDHQQRYGFSFWAVIERQTGELIGDAGLYMRHRAALGEIELGYTLGASHWGKGYGTEAAGLCLRAAFSEFGAREVVARVQPPNEQSVALVTKLGFQPDGEALARGAPHTLYRLTREAFEHA